VISLIEDAAALLFFVVTVVVPILAALFLGVVAFLVLRRLTRRTAPVPSTA
jgi:predicted PurR-regulated permease PerM